MDKRQIFNRIIEVTAQVCDVTTDEILDGTRKEDVVTARSITIFWLTAAGFSVESIKGCTDISSSSQVNNISSRIEDYWVNRFAYHMLVKEVGRRLLDIAHSVGEDFDMDIPINHMRRITGKY